MVIVAQSREYTKNHQIVYFKGVNVKVYEMYLNKAIIKKKSQHAHLLQLLTY